MNADFEKAYAKINLALHVRKRRDDGYHELESLVAFLDDGDFLTAQPAERDNFTVNGQFAAHCGDLAENLVLRSLAWARERAIGVIPPLAIELTKQLPVAAGLGGGSADAAALLRILNRQAMLGSLFDLSPDAANLGADVPACLFSRPLIMRGIGEHIQLIDDNSLGNIQVLLVNPGVAVPTGPVFQAWDQIDRGAIDKGSALEIVLSGRNDLQSPAIALCPKIGDVMTALNATQPMVARMSGSGATCFALYDTPDKAAAIEKQMKDRYPTWWVKTGRLTLCQ
jgi:4-diphosphocytidyl-2-C-methyl-D-erythritol kinase